MERPINNLTVKDETGEATLQEGISEEPARKRAKNAFTELMSKKPTSPELSSSKSHTKYNFKTMDKRANGLLEYIKNPESFGPTRVIKYDDDWVLINDMYPKSSVHLLLLPRNPKFYNAHPYEASKDTAWLASAKAEVEKAKEIVASELQRLYGHGSASEQVRIKAMESDDPPLPILLPPGRDWKKEVKAGVHSNPSMNHLHIHILSKEHHSPAMRQYKHYNSFNTPFLVSLDELPLASKEEVKKHDGVNLTRDLICWRCGENFGRKFAKLKRHVDEEFEEWKKE